MVVAYASTLFVLLIVLLFIEDTQAVQNAPTRWAFFFWLSEMIIILGLIFRLAP